MGWGIARYLLPAIAVVAVVVSCTTQGNPNITGGGSLPNSGGTLCGTPHEGCPCDNPGTVVECGRVERTSGDQVSCSMGKRTCVGDKWGACVGSEIVVKTLAPSVLAGSISPKAVTQGPCPPPPSPLSNVCDPYCNQVVVTDPITIPGGASGSCQFYEPADDAASYAALPASHRRLPASCTQGATDECGHDNYCGAGGVCAPFVSGDTQVSKTGNCGGTWELDFTTPCDNAGTETFAVCNRGGLPANTGTVHGLVYRESLVGKPTTVSLHKAPTNATIRGTCTLDLTTNPIPAGFCKSFARDTLCPGVDWTGGGSNVSTIQWNMPDWTGVAPDPAQLNTECIRNNNYTVYAQGTLLACQGVGCSSAGVTLQTTGGGVTGCAPGPEMSGTTCAPATQYQDCQQDHRCEAGTCVWNGGIGYYDGAVAGPDLTIGAACQTGGSEYIPVCNRGSVAIAGGTPINIHFSGSSPLADSCAVPGGPPDCTDNTPAAGLTPGKCFNITCAIPGNKYAIVSGVAEPPGLCANNQAFVKTSPTCAACTLCDTRISGKVYDPSGAPPAAGSNNIALAGITVFEPAGALTTFVDGVTCDSCAALDSPSTARAVTDAAGSFTLSGVTPGPNTRVVIQSGRWRREISVPVTACTDNTPAAGTFRMPKNRTDGAAGHADIPKIAMVAGSASCDPLSCLIRKIGVSDSEVQPRTGPADTARFQYWRHAAGSFDHQGAAPLRSVGPLLSTSVLNEYTAVAYDCYCSGSNPFSVAERQALRTYVDAGGRVFMDHWGGVHMFGSAEFPNTGTYSNPDGSGVAEGYVPATQPYQQLFRDWLPNASVAPLSFVSLAEPRYNLTNPQAGTVEWVLGRTDNNWGAGSPPGNPVNAPNRTLSLSFETPLSSTCATGGTGRVLFNDMHVSAGRATVAGQTTFPLRCDNSLALTDEERALEYQFFQLTACQIGGATPPAPPAALAATNVFRDFEGICPPGHVAEWGFFFWQSTTPPGTSIELRAATADDQASLPPSPPAPAPTTVGIGTASGPSIVDPNWASDANTVASHLYNDPPGPPAFSKRWLRVYMKFNPIGAVPPVLTSYRQDYSCKPAE